MEDFTPSVTRLDFLTVLRKQCIYPGSLWVFCHHEHEVDVDQVCAAADADDAAL